MCSRYQTTFVYSNAFTLCVLVACQCIRPPFEFRVLAMADEDVPRTPSFPFILWGGRFSRAERHPLRGYESDFQISIARKLHRPMTPNNGSSLIPPLSHNLCRENLKDLPSPLIHCHIRERNLSWNTTQHTDTRISMNNNGE